jgi:outer membrane protein assembly factor BamB
MQFAEFHTHSLAPMKSSLQIPLALFAACGALTQIRAEENWARFGGPEGNGRSAETAMATKWDASAVVWKAKLKGEGQSAVVNWGDKLFLTSATDKGAKRWLHCLDRKSGKLLWEREVACAKPEDIHKMNTWATPTCVTDGERVVAFFGPGGIHCFDLDGKPLWQRNLGEFPGTWGIAASPIIDGNLVIQNCDAEGASSLVALDKKTGAPVWTAKREDKPKGGWSTPVLITAGARRELILNGEQGVNAYDPATGKDLWFCSNDKGRGEPIPVFDHGLLYVVNGLPGDTYAVKPGGIGNVSASHRVWHTKVVGGRDLPTPAVVGEYELISSMSGMLTTYDAKTGAIHFSERLGSQVSASPVTAGGLVYFQMENGEVIVVKPGKTLEIVSRNPLGSASDEIFRAGLSPIKGQWFARSQSTVYCIGAKK